MRPSDCRLYAVTVEFHESHRISDPYDGDFQGWSPVQRIRKTFNIVAGSDVCTVKETVIGYALAKVKYACPQGRDSMAQVVSVEETKIDAIIEIHQ
jgi:hypothetical protein